MKYSYSTVDALSWMWIKTKVDILYVEDACGIVVRDKAGAYVAACVMDTWTDNTVTCTFAIEKRMVLKEGFVQLCCSYIFEDRGMKKILAQVAEDNLTALAFDKHIGFTEKCTIEDVYSGGVGCVILELKKENCRYLLDEVV